MTALMQPMSATRLSAKAGPRTAAVRSSAGRRPMICCAHQGLSVSQELQTLRQKLVSAGAAAAIGLAALSGAAPSAIASEFDIVGSATPTAYYVDDASVLSKATRGEVTARLKGLEFATGYHLEVVTVRKLEFETDAFAFAEKAREGWYGGKGGEGKDGVILVVTATKEGALTGSPAFLEAIGEELIDDLTTNNIPIYAEQEKYNQTVLSSIERIDAKLRGLPVPDGPKRTEDERKRTYKTKAETENSKGVTTAVVVSLLLIAVVVPMLQYYGYTAKE